MKHFTEKEFIETKRTFLAQDHGWLICFRFTRTVLMELCMEMWPQPGAIPEQHWPSLPLDNFSKSRQTHRDWTSWHWASGVGWNYSNVSHVHQISLYSVIEQANLKAQIAERDGSSNVKNAVLKSQNTRWICLCKHEAFSFGQCTYHLQCTNAIN